MNSTSSTTSLNDFLDRMDTSNPPFLSCPDCVCKEYDPDNATNNADVHKVPCWLLILLQPRLHHHLLPHLNVHSSRELTLLVRKIYLDPNERRWNNIDEIMKSARISYRTYQRKRPIAELQIFDPGKFDQVLQRCLMGENRTRLNQDFLDQNCQQNLDRPDMKMKRRAAIAAAGS